MSEEVGPSIAALQVRTHAHTHTHTHTRVQASLADTVSELDQLQREKDLIKGTCAYKSELKETENFLLDRLGVQVCIRVLPCHLHTHACLVLFHVNLEHLITHCCIDHYVTYEIRMHT